VEGAQLTLADFLAGTAVALVRWVSQVAHLCRSLHQSESTGGFSPPSKSTERPG
jgi:hypothetical protein